MRKAASRSVLLFNFTKNLSSSQLLLFLVPLQHSHSHHTVPRQPFNGELNQQRLVQLLQECSRVRSLDSTKCLHALAITMGSYSPQPIFLNNNTISAYVFLGELLLARKVFDEMPRRNVVSYNTMIGAYGRHGNAEEAWKLFSEMRGCGFQPTQFTFGGLLSCASLDLCRGFHLQGLIIKSGLLFADAFAGTALLGLFGRNGCLDEAHRTFEDMPQKNLVTWNSMISLFGHHGFAELSLIMFCKLMRMEGPLSEYSYIGVLSGFVSEQDLELGEQVHGLLIKNGLGCKVLIANAMINMYVKCSGPYKAEKMFGEVLLRDVVSWNTIIGALAKSDRPGKALELFLKMYVDGVWPNQTTFVSVINSCSSLQILMCGKFIHAKTVKFMLESDVFVGSALVDLYAKHDVLEDAHHCFDDIEEKNVVSWNALILGYSKKCCLSSVSLLREMIQLGYWPNEFSFSAVLKSSFILELQQLHSLIIRMGYHQNEYVSCSLITSYAKNGFICDALILVPATNTPLPAVPSNVIAKQHMQTYQDCEQVEVRHVVGEYALAVACRLFLGIDEPAKYEKLANPLKYIGAGILSIPINLPGTAFNRAIKASKAISEEVEVIIKQRKIDLLEKRASPTEDILSHMLLATDENGQFFNEADIASYLNGLLHGGSDPVRSILTFIMKYLAELPDVYHEVLREQMEIAKSKEQSQLLNWEDIRKMKYSWNVANEVFRLMPPVLGAFREAITDFTYAGHTIPKGTKIHWNSHSTHKDPKYFQNPEKFDPSRFEGNGPPPYAFVPFGGGPRMCPGNEYTRLIILVFMHNIVTKFRWELLTPDEKIVFDPHPRPTQGLPIRLHTYKP